MMRMAWIAIYHHSSRFIAIPNSSPEPFPAHRSGDADLPLQVPHRRPQALSCSSWKSDADIVAIQWLCFRSIRQKMVETRKWLY